MKQPRILTKIPRDKNVILMESDNNYTILHLSDGCKIISGYCLTFYEKITDNQSFMRLNRSMMVNKLYVENINLSDSELILMNGRKITISRRRMKAFRAWI